MSYIYCHESSRTGRWYYHETPGFRDGVPGSSSSFARGKDTAYRFATKEEAWEHCRTRRRSTHWKGAFGKWIVIRVRDAQQAQRGEAPMSTDRDTDLIFAFLNWWHGDSQPPPGVSLEEQAAFRRTLAARFVAGQHKSNEPKEGNG